MSARQVFILRESVLWIPQVFSSHSPDSTNISFKTGFRLCLQTPELHLSGPSQTARIRPEQTVAVAACTHSDSSPLPAMISWSCMVPAGFPPIRRRQRWPKRACARMCREQQTAWIHISVELHPFSMRLDFCESISGDSQAMLGLKHPSAWPTVPQKKTRQNLA